MPCYVTANKTRYYTRLENTIFNKLHTFSAVHITMVK